MKWFKHLRIKFKLLTNFAVTIIFSVILAVVAGFSISNLDNSYSYLLDSPQKRLEYLMQLDTNCSDMRRATTAISLNSGDPEVIDNYWVQFEDAYNAALDNVDKYLESVNADTRSDADAKSSNSDQIINMKQQLESYRGQAKAGMESARADNNFAETNALFLGGAPMITTVVESIEELIPQAEAFIAEISEANTREKDSALLWFAILLVIIIALSVAIAFYMSGLIATPMILLTGFMNRARTTGDIALSPGDVKHIQIYSQARDEIGQCIDAVAGFVKRMGEVSEQLEIISTGNLTAGITQLSDSDVMGISLNKMSASLNAMFNEINISTGQIAVGARQIADGAQTLAQGSAEQATSIEELSASISDITDSTKQNANVAREAADLSTVIKGNAEKGNSQMERMMQAVKEINEASGQISKVIKVIDDIAFQTNILALNAAVEAARAGQHGKGFAVVAEEVRNLAGKSAEAAKDTGELIENSISKANLGLGIATETSASLKEIVEGINRNTEIIEQIAQSSDEQALAIAQVNNGIEQVAQVVQQNSATAEQSAASSEEMSSQSAMLEELIAQFKLKNFEVPPSLNEPSYAKPLSIPQESAPALADRGNDYGKY